MYKNVHTKMQQASSKMQQASSKMQQASSKNKLQLRENNHKQTHISVDISLLLHKTC